MKLFRSIAVIVTLLVQVLPVFSGGRDQQVEGCSMACCAWLAAEEMEFCDCEQTLPPANPAQVPPASGRGLLAQVVWVESPDGVLGARLSMTLVSKSAGMLEHVIGIQPHVRLPVLFCSFLN